MALVCVCVCLRARMCVFVRTCVCVYVWMTRRVNGCTDCLMHVLRVPFCISGQVSCGQFQCVPNAFCQNGECFCSGGFIGAGRFLCVQQGNVITIVIVIVIVMHSVITTTVHHPETSHTHTHDIIVGHMVTMSNPMDPILAIEPKSITLGCFSPICSIRLTVLPLDVLIPTIDPLLQFITSYIDWKPFPFRWK